MTLMVNIRHLFYGITMIEKYKDTGASKPYLIFALTDETFSLVCSPDLPQGVDRKLYYLFVSALNQFYWIVGSIAGALIGSARHVQYSGHRFFYDGAVYSNICQSSGKRQDRTSLRYAESSFP